MRLLIRDGKKSDRVRSLALYLAGYVPEKDWRGEIVELLDFVRKDIRYTRDICDVETIASADQVLAQAAGDCDDKTILLGALLESIGHATQLFALGFNRGSFSHVLLLVWCAGEWHPLDATVDKAPGWLPPGIRQRMFLSNGD